MTTLTKLEPKNYITDLPKYPDFPHAEWERRIKRAKKLMSENEVDAVVLWKRENIRYFFGFQTTHWEIPSLQPAVGIIPLDGDPVLIVPDLFLINAQVFGFCREIWIQMGGHEVPKERLFPIEVANVLKIMGLGKKNIALESGYLGCMWIPRPLNDIEAFKNGLPDAKFVDGDKVIWGCRMIKSALEIDRIRQAAQVITKCHSAVVEQYRPGMTEMDIGKIIHGVQVAAGDFRGGDTTVCSHIRCNLEKEGVCDILALDGVPIGKDDYLDLDLQHKHKGYWADIARQFQVSKLTDRMIRNYKLCEDGLADAASILKPGVKVSDLYKVAVGPVKKAGLPAVEMAGHGIGLDIHEPPSIDSTNDMIIEEGMVLALEVWVLTSLKRKGGEGVFGFEDQYAVTSSGYEKIEGLPKSIIQVSHPIC